MHLLGTIIIIIKMYLSKEIVRKYVKNIEFVKLLDNIN